MSLTAAALYSLLAVLASDPPQPNDGAAFAERMQQALRAFEAIEITGYVQNTDLRPDGTGGTILGGVTPVRFRTLMSRDQLRCDISRDDRLLASYAWYEGRFQEYRPNRPNRPLIEYDAPVSSGSDDTVLKEDYDCMIASQVRTWLNFDESLITFWDGILREATRIDDQVVGDRECVVFEWRRKDGEKTIVRHVLFIEKDTSLPAAFYTEGFDVLRKRVFHVKPTENPTATDAWRIRPKDNEDSKSAHGRQTKDAPQATKESTK